MNGFIYFIQARSGPIKIGFTTRPVAKRFREWQNSIPFASLKLLGYMNGTRGQESLIKRAFRKRMIRSTHTQTSEWFKADASLLEYIAKSICRT